MTLIPPVFFIGINKVDGAIMNGNLINLNENISKLKIKNYNKVIYSIFFFFFKISIFQNINFYSI